MADLTQLLSPSKCNNQENFVSSASESSFEILNLSELDLGNFGFHGRPSILYREALELLNEDSGRESLGILNLSTNLEDLMFSPIEKLSSSPILNQRLSNSFLDSRRQSHEKSTFNRGFLYQLPKRSDMFFDESSKVRLQSLPIILGKIEENEENQMIKTRRSLNLEQGTSAHESRETMSTSDDNYSDSVFIEANHLASKIADGSILENSYEGDNILDSTPQPEWNDISNLDEQSNENLDSNEVLKTFNKLFPGTAEIPNEINIVNEEDKPQTVQSAETSIKITLNSKVAQEFLQPLVDFENRMKLNLEQTLEAQSIISNLEELLAKHLCDKCTCRSSALKIDMEATKVFQNKTYEKIESSNPTSKVGSSCNETSKGKLKPKKSSSLKRGPLKALVPINGAVKEQDIENVTIIKTDLKIQRSSSPVMNKSIKPVAQSTPTENKTAKKAVSNDTVSRRKFSGSVSPFASNRTRTVSENEKPIPRRNSFSDMNSNKKAPLVKSYSTGVTGISATQTKSSYGPKKIKEPLLKTVSKVPTKTSSIKPTNLVRI